MVPIEKSKILFLTLSSEQLLIKLNLSKNAKIDQVFMKNSDKFQTNIQKLHISDSTSRFLAHKTGLQRKT